METTNKKVFIVGKL